ncbi:MAG: hypothetical protein LBJ92_02620 [Holosporales bacterium]|jgi:hypothetical protein|nr:hypothetical protein [Holosporales bacterium]
MLNKNLLIVTIAVGIGVTSSFLLIGSAHGASNNPFLADYVSDACHEVDVLLRSFEIELTDRREYSIDYGDHVSYLSKAEDMRIKVNSLTPAISALSCTSHVDQFAANVVSKYRSLHKRIESFQSRHALGVLWWASGSRVPDIMDPLTRLDDTIFSLLHGRKSVYPSQIRDLNAEFNAIRAHVKETEPMVSACTDQNARNFFDKFVMTKFFRAEDNLRKLACSTNMVCNIAVFR